MRGVKYNYSNLSQPLYVDKITYIIFRCGSNPNFLTLPIDISTILEPKLIAYTGKLNLIKSGDHAAVQDAKNIRKAIDGFVKKNGLYINDVCQGDVAKLETSGYDLTKERVLKDKDEVVVEQSNQSGTGKIFIRPVENAKAYLVFYHIDPLPDVFNEQEWTRQAMTTKSYQWISGLQPHKKYWMVYYTVTTGGESVRSEYFPFTLV